MRSHGYLGVPPIGTIFRALEKWIDGMGDKAVISGEENVEIIKEARKDKKAIYLYDGANILKHLNDTKLDKLREKYNIPKNKFVVVYTGALIENKGINHILESIPFVLQSIKDIHFVIGGFPAEWVKQYIIDKGITKNVTVISPLNYFELTEVNRLGEVAIDPKDARVKQASGKILQYMAVGLGIICANRPTNHKYLSDESAQFVDVVDAHSVTTAIEKFYNNRDFLQQCKNNAHKDVKKFDWQRIGKKLEKVYKEIIE
jgi:glycosyltransferase involved in cell wall biosynthesis